MIPASHEVASHLALALGRYAIDAEREARMNGRQVPVEVLEWFTQAARFYNFYARVRQEATTLDSSSTSEHGGAMTDGLLLTKRQAAAELAVSVRQLERLIADPGVSLSTVRAGGAVRIRRSDLEQYVADLATRPGGTFRDDLTTKEQSA